MPNRLLHHLRTRVGAVAMVAHLVARLAVVLLASLFRHEVQEIGYFGIVFREKHHQVDERPQIRTLVRRQ